MIDYGVKGYLNNYGYKGLVDGNYMLFATESEYYDYINESEEKKMSIASKYNKMNLFTFQTPKDFEYVSLEALFTKNGAKTVYPVKALYINKKSKFGDAPVAVTDSCMVNLPAHLLAMVNEMLEDDELIAAVNNDLFGFTIYSYYPKNSDSMCYSVTWVDIEK